MVSIVCATFVLVCAVKRNICAIMVLKILLFYFSHVTSLSPPSTCPCQRPNLIKIVSVLCVKRNIYATIVRSVLCPCSVSSLFSLCLLLCLFTFVSSCQTPHALPLCVPCLVDCLPRLDCFQLFLIT